MEKAEHEKESKKNKGGVFRAFKYIFTHKQTRAVALVALLFAVATGYTGKYQNMIEVGVARGTMTAAQSALILTVYPLVNGIFTLIAGFIIDDFGRKKSSLILGLWAAVGLGIFAWGCTHPMNPYLISVAYGISIAGLWSISDMIYFVITSESTPTEQRASVVGSMQLIGMVGTGFNMVFNNLVTRFAGSMNLPTVLTLTYLPLMAIALVILQLKVRETKDVDLDNISIE